MSSEGIGLCLKRATGSREVTVLRGEKEPKMDGKAVQAARRDFERAFQDMDDLVAANEFDDVERHWAAFLVSAGRVYTKLEQGSKASPEAGAWWSGVLHQRRTDELLCYIWHARNAEEHTLERVTQRHDGSAKMVQPSDAEREAIEGQLVTFGKPFAVLGSVEVVWPHVKLGDAVDRGKRYAPPKSHLGQPLKDPLPKNVGLLALARLEGLLTEAEALAV